MKIEELIDKYFEGNTTCEEEARLRAYFSSTDIPSSLIQYKPMFDYFSQEIASNLQEQPVSKRKKRVWLYTLTAAAACFLIVFGIGSLLNTSTHYCGDNYVIINGTCYTDMHKIQTHAKQALKEVGGGDIANGEAMQNPVDQELEELRKLFTSEE